MPLDENRYGRIHGSAIVRGEDDAMVEVEQRVDGDRKRIVIVVRVPDTDMLTGAVVWQHLGCALEINAAKRLVGELAYAFGRLELGQ
jgi:hypothetical protein